MADLRKYARGDHPEHIVAESVRCVLRQGWQVVFSAQPFYLVYKVKIAIDPAKTLYIRYVLTLIQIGEIVATKRRALGLSQATLARQARVGHSTLDALENGRIGELGYSKITRILTALSLELTIQEAANRRPTLEELMEEDRDDQSLDRRR
ncbi:helix-turn-helix domain-containing protein [Edaphobacter sp. 12200R-103]|uniref:helix-turn-helix domain-containing protein n=1 Tax=Edaphobacter sp. 12200R-103 TaxID=2703788 RepID=UPI00138BD24A|nr:helix-turn-helix domain-containing protein [Edaphobacter sp. 12200R-103]QHS50601.1 helix-turn-helix domain-containing protein [Edaphobacter sp. 12200R-103]